MRIKDDWLVGFTINTGDGSVDEVEAWAIFKGLKLVWSKGYGNIMVESDAKKIVDWLTNNANEENSSRGLAANVVCAYQLWMKKH
nr:uncharacterized protein LOC109152979 [Ipomoea trifida]